MSLKFYIIEKRASLIFVLTILSLAAGCASRSMKGPRVLSEAEKAQYGLNGEISEAPLCPTKFDRAGTRLIQAGPCELVTCKEESGKIICRSSKVDEAK